MYIPKAFRIDDLGTLQSFIREHGFATLVTGGDEPFVTHLPLLLDPQRGPFGTLVGHVARSNPHWQVDHARYASVAVFHGPHAYISPTWYPNGRSAVPTWNYAAVHATGKLTLVNDAAEVAAKLERLVRVYEDAMPSPWINPLSPDLNAKMIAGVVAFEMPIERLEGKFKLSQNRTWDDQIGAVEGLEKAGDVESETLARFARKHLVRPSTV